MFSPKIFIFIYIKNSLTWNSTFNHFVVYFCRFAVMCNCNHCIISEHLHHSPDKHLHIKSSLQTFFPVPQCLVLTYFLCLSLSCVDRLYSGIMQNVLLCVWLLSCGAVFSRFMHMLAGTGALFTKWITFHCVWTYYILFVHSSADEYFSYFHILVSGNDATVSMCTQTSLVYIQRRDIGISGQYVWL